MASDKLLQLSVKVNAETGELEVLGAKLRGAGAAAKDAGSNFSGLTGDAKDLLASFLPFATGAGILAFFTSAVKGAEEEAASLRRLDFALQANGSSLKQNEQAVNSWVAAIQTGTRFSDTQAIAALEKMTRVTGSLSQAQAASQLAMGLSVQSGQKLETTLQQVTDLMNGNERALVQLRREFGSFIGDADTTQEALDRLQAKFTGAAFAEEGLGKQTEQLKNAWGDFQDQVGNSLAGPLTVLLGWLASAVNSLDAFGLKLATVMAAAQVRVVAYATAMKELATLDFSGAVDAFKTMHTQLASIEEESEAQLKAINDRKAAATIASNQDRVLLRAQENEAQQAAREKELEDEQRQAERIAEIDLTLQQKLVALGDDTIMKRRVQAELEIQSQRNKINSQVKNEQEKARLLDKLDEVRLKQTREFDKQEVLSKVGASLDILDFSVQALGQLNAMGDLRTKEDARRAKVILGLEKAIAIARTIAAAAAAPPGIAQAVAAAQIAFIGAQFAAQSSAIDSARQAANQGSEKFELTTDLGAGGGGRELTRSFGGGGSGGGGSSSLGASGGGAQEVHITIGDVIVQLSLDHLDSTQAQAIMDAIGQQLRARLPGAVRFAVAVDETAQERSGLAS